MWKNTGISRGGPTKRKRKQLNVDILKLIIFDTKIYIIIQHQHKKVTQKEVFVLVVVRQILELLYSILKWKENQMVTFSTAQVLWDTFYPIY